MRLSLSKPKNITMKKQRKNTVSREAAAKDMPREENKEPRAKRPGNFDKKPRPGRKPRRDNDRSDRGGYSKSNDRSRSNERSSDGEKKEYFKEFYKENSKKRREDFKVKKEHSKDASGKKTRNNTIDRSQVEKREERKPRRDFDRREESNDRKPKRDFKKRDDRNDRKPRREFDNKDSRDDRKPRREFDSRDERKPRRDFDKRDEHSGSSEEKRPYNKVRRLSGDKPEPNNNGRGELRSRKPKWTKEQKLERAIKEGRVAPPEEKEIVEEKMPLNKYISRAGVCSRREAAELIKAGEVKVNGVVNKEPGYKVVEGDVVTYKENDLEKQEKSVYLLLNKAKDYITTTDDPEGRKTVMDLFTEVDERIFPVGRLDRNTTGLLLLTNDGHLAQKLSHPKFMSKKVYQVKLDKELSEAHFEQIQKGLDLEDGKAEVDSLAFINPETRAEVGIEIHIGKNRIVRRIFEHLGYDVKYLDRVMYAGLTKKNLPRGKWRALTDKEIIFLKHFK